MNYKLINPPNIPVFNNLYEAQSKDVHEFFDWFINVKQTRISILEKCIQTSGKNFQEYKADYSLASLEIIGSWLPTVVNEVPRSLSDVEKDRERMKEKFPDLDPPQYELDSLSVSIGFDVGMYLGEILRSNYPELKWILDKSKTVDRNQPVLGYFLNKTTFNPRLIGAVVATKALKQEVDLVTLYNNWVKYIIKHK